jgi:alkylated DNA repair dioxygenase AlkB
MEAAQPSLFGWSPPAARPLEGARRIQLDDDAWIDHLPGWVSGHEALFEHLKAETAWRVQRREMYEKIVEVPRLVARLPDDGDGHPLLESLRRALEERYETPFPNIGLALYRDGSDSVAWHGDQVAREMEETVMATVSVGAPRRFLLRPTAGGRARSLRLGWGDLVVMGGACQRTWQHCVPKERRADPRLVIMYRPRWERAASFDGQSAAYSSAGTRVA